MEKLNTFQLIDLLKSHTELFYLPFAENEEEKEKMYLLRKNILIRLMEKLEEEKEL